MKSWPSKKVHFYADSYQQTVRHQQSRLQQYIERRAQEKRDYEMAVEISEQINKNVDSSPSQLIRFPSAGMQQDEKIKKRYDLSKWNYSALRDTINSSSDSELLEACRLEFQRRLKAYHAWKNARNTRSLSSLTDIDSFAEKETMSQSNMSLYAPSAPSLSVISEKPIVRHRYFRIPLARPNYGAGTKTEQFGWWAAHFDGQYIARQIELLPDGPPVLMQAGVDGKHMCQLSLEETGLTRKPGAEINEQDFERVWIRYGGAPAYYTFYNM